MNDSVTFENRNLMVVFLLFIFTGGLYFFYWLYKTKEEINRLGGNIPTLWFAILPFFNIFFDYRYAQSYIKQVKHQDDTASVIAYFALILFLPIIAILVIQHDLNNYEI